MAGFTNNVLRVNAVAERSPGFLWRWKDEAATIEGTCRLVLVDGGTAQEFDGSIDDYIAFVLAKDPAPAKGGGGSGISKKDQRKAAAEAREKNQELRKQARKAEAELERLQKLRSAIELAMFDPKSAEATLSRLSMTELMKRRAEIEALIETAELAWLVASEALEGIAA